MIDWITCEIPCRHEPLNGGAFIKINPDGEIDYESPLWKVVTGSYDTSIRVRSSGTALDGSTSHLRLSGNPAKYLQGHNIFGINDLGTLMQAFTNRLFEDLGICPGTSDRKQIRAGEYTVSRIDITQSYALRSRSEVIAFIRSAEFKAKTRAGRPSRKGSTLYFSKQSRRWTIKYYSKGQELEAHGINDKFNSTPLKQFADNLLRVELTLRSTELRERNIHFAKFFTPNFMLKLHAEYLLRIDMKAQLNLTDESVRSLPRCLQATYCLWEKGCDLRLSMKEPTFYRHRSELLKYNVDISLQPNGVTQFDNVVPLIRVLEAKPVKIPAWAYELKLIVGA